MVVTLFLITLISSTVVGLVYKVTVAPIEEAKSLKVQSAVAMVLPEFDNDPMADKMVQDIDGSVVTVYTATKGGENVGYAIETFSNNGFSGEIRVMVGLLSDGTIYKVETLSHNETPGLGDKMESGKSDFSAQFAGKNPGSANIKVKKDGGDIDAITAATISSRAFVDAVERAYNIYKTLK